MGVVPTKAAVRRTLLARRNGLRADLVRCWSQAVCERLISLSEVAGAGAVAAYMAFGGEIDVTPVIRFCGSQDNPVYLPRFSAERQEYQMAPVAEIETDLAPGAFGVPEPLARIPSVSREVVTRDDVAWLVPGVAFDETGNRLGRGKGFYDRLLHGTKGTRIGVAYDWQIVDRLPAGEHDVPMHLLVSESRIVDCRVPPLRRT